MLLCFADRSRQRQVNYLGEFLGYHHGSLDDLIALVAQEVKAKENRWRVATSRKSVLDNVPLTGEVK